MSTRPRALLDIKKGTMTFTSSRFRIHLIASTLFGCGIVAKVVLDSVNRGGHAYLQSMFMQFLFYSASLLLFLIAWLRSAKVSGTRYWGGLASWFALAWFGDLFDRNIVFTLM